jgi:hypothetical protein
MAWEKRGENRYFYRSIRRDGHVKKLYYGTGPAARMAADADALNRAERMAAKEVFRAACDLLDAAVRLTRDLNRGCELLAVATLLAAGFHRPSRHKWRKWRHGRRAIQESA